MSNKNKKRKPFKFKGKNGEDLTYSQYYRMVCQNMPDTRKQPKASAKPVVSTRFGYYKVEKNCEVLNFENYLKTIETIRSLEEGSQDEVSGLFSNQIIDVGAYDEIHETFDPGDMENMHTVYAGRSNNPNWGTLYK